MIELTAGYEAAAMGRRGRDMATSLPTWGQDQVDGYSTQIADALTKSMTPHQLFRLPEEACVQVSDMDRKLTKDERLAMK